MPKESLMDISIFCIKATHCPPVSNSVRIFLISNLLSLFQKHMLYDQIWIAVRFGHRKLAGALMEEQTKAGGGIGFGFGGTNWNQVHKDVRAENPMRYCYFV